MPTVGRHGRFRLYFFSNERNEPPHVHVSASGCEAKVWLAPVVLARSFGFAPHELTEILRIVAQNEQILINAWRNFFGP